MSNKKWINGHEMSGEGFQSKTVPFEAWRAAAVEKLLSAGISSDDIGTAFAPEAGPTNVTIVESDEVDGAWVALEIWVDAE